MTALVAILAVAVILLGVLVVGLLRSHAEIVRALHGLGVNLDPEAENGEHAHGRRPVAPRAAGGLGPAADISGVTPTLEPIAVSVTGPNRRTLLAFLSSGCLTCREFWDAFRSGGLAIPGDARLVVVAKGADAESPADIARLAPPNRVTVLSSEAWEAYNAPGSPYFVLVDGAGPTVIGEGTGTTWTQVANMLTSALADTGIGARPPARPHHGEAPADNRERIDAELRAAGIGPGHPSLHAPAADDDAGDRST
jgi:hypothetical protein